MEKNDKLKNEDLKIIKVLYDDWKKTNPDGFQAESINLNKILNDTGMSKEQANSIFNNLQDFDFISRDGDEIKLLPSGIKYSLGQFDNLQ
jgi:hypothetical protein